MTYRHHYPMLLQVSGMLEEGTVGLTPKKVADALREMADRIEHEPVNLRDILGSGPVNAEREDRWVLRSVEHKNRIMGDGGWHESKSIDVMPYEMVQSEAAARLTPMKGTSQDPASIWVRPEDIGQDPLIIEFRADEGDVSFYADATEFMAEADGDIVGEFAHSSFKAEDPRYLIDELLERNLPVAIAMAAHAEETGATFTLEIGDKDAAMRFLKECRPDIHEEVSSSLDIDI